MYIVDIIPLVFLPRNQDQVLSYFNKEPIDKGSLVEIMLGKRIVQGVVLGSFDILSRKLTLRKSSDFQLKNISKILSNLTGVSERQFEIAKFISSYYYAPLGISLSTVLPPFWLKKGYMVDDEDHISQKNTVQQSYIISNPYHHADDYIEEIKYRIKRKEQVFLLTAENSHAEYFMDKYKDLNPIFISSNLGIKKYFAVWRAVASGNAKLIIGTRIGLFMHFKNLGLLIVDDESNETYKSDMTPRYCGPELAKFIASFYGAKLILSSIVPRLETYNLAKFPINPTRIGNVNVVDVKREIKDANFSVFSRDLKEAIIDSVNKKQKIILYVPRRGHANFILCQTCGNTLKCPNCSVSMVYHKNLDKLKCHHCETTSIIPKTCPICKGYNLKLYGLGTSGVKEKLEKWLKYEPRLFSLAENIFILDSDNAKKPKAEQKILEDFMKAKPALLITTQMIFGHSYLIKADLLGIINADALIHIPDFRSSEKLFRQLYTLSWMANKVIIQTHNPTEKAIELVSRGKVQEFLKDELEHRKNFEYPPFVKLIKLTYVNKDPRRAKNESLLLYEKLKNSPEVANDISVLSPSPAFVARERGLYIWNIILKVNPDLEIKKRNEILRYVPTGWTVDVDPKNLI